MRAFIYAYFQLRDKDGGCTTRSTIAKKHAAGEHHGCVFYVARVTDGEELQERVLSTFFAAVTLTLTQ